MSRGLGALLLALSLAGPAWSPPGHAEGPASSFGARSPGSTSCELVLRMHERAPTGTERQFYDWAQGYFAGRSAGTGGERRLAPDGSERDAAFRTLLGYCGRNGTAPFSAAVAALWDATSPAGK